MLALIGGTVYFAGYIWSGVMSFRLKKWGWLFALLFLGPISYPFFAIINRDSSKITFRIFWVGLLIFVLSFAALVATKPQGAASAAVLPQLDASAYALAMLGR